MTTAGFALRLVSPVQVPLLDLKVNDPFVVVLKGYYQENYHFGGLQNLGFL